MATLLLKKSYQINSLKEVPFKDLWGRYGVFTTMRLIGKPLKIIFLNNHLKNLICSANVYRIYEKKLNSKIKKILKMNLNKNMNYNHLLRLAINKDLISISIRNRTNINKKFKLNLLNYKRIKPEYKNLKYQFILKKIKKIDTKSTDLALINNNQIFETATANLIFIKNDKIYSPLRNVYKGITLKFINKKFKINYCEIYLKNLMDYNEIILLGSGKGVISVNEIRGTYWRRKSLKHYKILSNCYKKAVTKCPRYYS